VPVVRPQTAETTSLGAAFLAGLAVGFWKDRSEIARQWKPSHRFLPKMKSAARSRLIAAWTRALSRAKQWEQAEPLEGPKRNRAA
jgi:glycerol kinase